MQKNIRNFICALIAVLFAICFFVGKHFDKGWKLQLDIWCILKLILTVAVVYFAVCCIYKGMDLLGRGRIRKNRINELVFEKNRGEKYLADFNFIMGCRIMFYIFRAVLRMMQSISWNNLFRDNGRITIRF